MGFKLKQVEDTEKIIVISDQDENNHLILNNLGDLLSLRQRINRYIDTQEYDGQLISKFPIMYQETIRSAEAKTLASERGYDGLSNSTLNSACAEGRIMGACKVGGRWEFPRRAFENWFKEWVVKKTGKSVSLNLTGNTQLPIDIPPQALQSLWIDEVKEVVWVEGHIIELTGQEYDILEYLYQRPGVLVSRLEILTNLFGPGYGNEYLGKKALDSAISRLRQKIEPIDALNQYLYSNRRIRQGMYKYIITVRGRGFKLNLAK